jgi:transposase
MDEPACPGCQELLRRVAELEARVSDLTRKLDDALRAGKRQAAPFRKGPPKPDPRTPGRKSGNAYGKHGHRPPPSPEQLAERHEAHLPDPCPEQSAGVGSSMERGRGTRPAWGEQRTG